jgi:hypothetical protein
MVSCGIAWLGGCYILTGRRLAFLICFGWKLKSGLAHLGLGYVECHLVVAESRRTSARAKHNHTAPTLWIDPRHPPPAVPAMRRNSLPTGPLLPRF